jgi:DNA-binding response OmpR family regulator
MKRVLIIEDQLEIAELERDYLEINEFEVTIETSGIKGLDKARTEAYDLIILDVMLGDTDGFRICKAIREETQVPIIFVSAQMEDIHKIRGLGLGADDYMTKPFSPQELVARVKAHIGRYDRIIKSSTYNQEVIQIGDLRIEKAARKVSRYDESINLTAREFDLLLFLAENPNIVFSKEQLFEALWGFDAYGDISTVAVHIKRVREKVELNPAQPVLIETLWGAGYRLNG